MILFTNLKEVKIDELEYNPVPVLKLTSDMEFSKDNLKKSQVECLQLLKREAEENNFRVAINDIDLQDIDI